MSNIFMSIENSKTNDPNRFRLYFTNKIDLRGNKKIALSDLSIHYSWHNIRGVYNNNKFRLSGPTWSKDVTLCLMVVMKYLKYKSIFLTKYLKNMNQMLSLMNSHQFGFMLIEY